MIDREKNRLSTYAEEWTKIDNNRSSASAFVHKSHFLKMAPLSYQVPQIVNICIDVHNYVG
jgi:hypothetical protein